MHKCFNNLTILIKVKKLLLKYIYIYYKVFNKKKCYEPKGGKFKIITTLFKMSKKGRYRKFTPDFEPEPWISDSDNEDHVQSLINFQQQILSANVQDRDVESNSAHNFPLVQADDVDGGGEDRGAHGDAQRDTADRGREDRGAHGDAHRDTADRGREDRSADGDTHRDTTDRGDRGADGENHGDHGYGHVHGGPLIHGDIADDDIAPVQDDDHGAIEDDDIAPVQDDHHGAIEDDDLGHIDDDHGANEDYDLRAIAEDYFGVSGDDDHGASEDDEAFEDNRDELNNSDMVFEEVDDYKTIFNYLCKEWLNIEVDHRVSKVASEAFWSLAKTWFHLMFKAKEIEKNNRKTPSFVHIRRQFHKKYVPPITLKFGFKDKETGAVSIVHDTVTPKNRFPPNRFEKLWEVASVQVFIF